MRLEDRLDAGQFAVLVELQPPKGVDTLYMAECAMRVRELVDAFVVPDMSGAVMRMSPLGGAALLQARGLETIVQVSCRDRNRLAIQGDLLAAYACGIAGVMAVEGDDPSVGDHPEAKTVNDLGRLELLNAIQGLQQGFDMAGMKLLGSPKFLVGSMADIFAGVAGIEAELERMNAEMEKGVEFFVTPPLFDLSSMDSILKKAAGMKKRIIPTVLLLKSAGMARYISLHFQKVSLPDSIVERMRNARDAAAEGIAVASETISALANEGFGGFLLSAAGWERRMQEVLNAVRGQRARGG